MRPALVYACTLASEQYKQVTLARARTRKTKRDYYTYCASLQRLLSLDGWPRVRLDGVLWFAFQLVVVFLARLAGGALRCRTVRLADVRVHVERAEHVDEQAGVQRQQGGDRFRVAAGRLELHLHRVEEHNDELHLEEGKW